MNFFWAFILSALLLSHSAQAMNVTSPFGWRIHPISGQWQFHAGVDLAFDYGTPIPALFDGLVISADDFDDGYGLQVLLYHPALDAFTRYAHCSCLHVLAGQNVPAGFTIADVGSSGFATGPHLHLEFIIKLNGVYHYSDPLSLWR